MAVQAADAPIVAQEPHTERWLDGLLRGIYAVRVPLAMALLSVFILTLFDQALEVHRVLTLERARNMYHIQWWLAVGSLTLLAGVLWQVARQIAEDAAGDIPAGVDPHPLCDTVLRWGPRVIATLPLLGAGLGIWLSRLPQFDLSNTPAALLGPIREIAALQQQFLMGAAIMAGIAVVFFLIVTIFERKLTPHGSSKARKLAVFNSWIVFPIVILASIVLLVRDPVHLPQRLGSIPVFALWMVNLAVLSALFSRYYRIFGVPLIGTFAVLFVVFEIFGLTDNHEFRHSANPDIQRPTVEAAFRSWLGARKDMDAYKSAGKPYPVYVVAAEGGGLYAAYQTAKFLSRMQDLCPNFAQHVFSISSVSGGSLGAAVFAGLSRNHGANDAAKPCLESLATRGDYEKRSDRILSRDMLAPVVWGGLFPDFLQRFIPYPIESFDRARALEQAFEQSWRFSGERSDNPLSRSLFEMCGKGGADCLAGATPLLAFNTSNVETGMQMVLSPLDFTSIGPPWTGSAKTFDFFSTGVDPVDIPLSTAIGLSARFPWISPAGWYTFQDPADVGQGKKARLRRMTFVDGAYVDNSGVATASKLAQSLGELHAKDGSLPPVEIKLIMISAAWIPFDRFWMDEPVNKAQGDLFSPLLAALSTWQGRGFTTQYDVSADPKPGYKIMEAGVYYNYLPLPLGWQLSSLSREYIDLFKGFPEKCDESQLDRSLQSHAALANTYINRANCVAAEIRRDLSPMQPASAAPMQMRRAITPAN
ncbi:MAG: hypothetical protein EKK41_29200 [Hyphomicrobiales bacterium]|nr:MAG: hypothetical protein EKK41_29200 [Hyphomicrobiales bacterium]